VLRQALPRLRGITVSISVTTRAPRPGERDGVDYFFVSAEEFARLMEQGGLLEHAAVHGHFYGTPRAWVMDTLEQGMDVILEIDVQGAIQVKASYPEAILIFLAPPSWPELARRLRSRGTEDEATVRRRLENARQELAKVEQYEYLIVNDRLREAVHRLRAIITAERSRPNRQVIERLLGEVQSDA
jgi:guanylate kinase